MSTATQTRSTPSRGRAGSTARNAIIEMLKDDHKRAKKAFRDFERLDVDEDAERCAEIVAQCCAELTVHATLEEEFLYPAARSVLSEEDLIDEAEVEHASAKELISQLQQMQPGDEKFWARFTVLGEYIKHHVKEEESEIFPQLGRAKLDWESLQEEILARREKLMTELMPAAAQAGNGTDRDSDDGAEEGDDEGDEGESDDGPPKAPRASTGRKGAGSARSGAAVPRKA